MITDNEIREHSELNNKNNEFLYILNDLSKSAVYIDIF